MIRTIVLLLLAIGAVFMISLSQGEQAISLFKISRAVIDPQSADFASRMIVQEIRLPRVIMAILVGAALAVAGLISQTVMRNPLAEPGLLGVNSGAALAALVLIVHLQWSSPAAISTAAFAGALTMASAIYVLSWRNGVSSIRIILIGIGLSSLAGAATSFMSVFGDITTVQKAQVWLAGSVYNARWNEIQVLTICLVPTFVAAGIATRQLDLMYFDDVTVQGLGARVQLTRGFLVLVCTLISGAAVAAAGVIAFAGLIAPHLARRLVGFRHARSLPVSALIGALLVSSADLLGRTVIAPAQLPAGLMTIMIGAPFFAFLLWERRHARA